MARSGFPSTGATVATGRTNLGSLIGDHAKTAIGSMLPTGTVIGAGANVFGACRPAEIRTAASPGGPDGRERLEEEGFLRIAGRVMPRRQVEFTEARRESLRATYRRLRAGCDPPSCSRLRLPRQLSRPRGGGRGAAHRRRVQRQGNRAAGGRLRAEPDRLGGRRPDSRAWGPLRRRPTAGEAVRECRSSRRSAPGTGVRRRLPEARPNIGPWAASPQRRWDRSASWRRR